MGYLTECLGRLFKRLEAFVTELQIMICLWYVWLLKIASQNRQPCTGHSFIPIINDLPPRHSVEWPNQPVGYDIPVFQYCQQYLPKFSTCQVSKHKIYHAN